MVYIKRLRHFSSGMRKDLAKSIMKTYLIDSGRVREGHTTDLKTSVLKSE